MEGVLGVGLGIPDVDLLDNLTASVFHPPLNPNAPPWPRPKLATTSICLAGGMLTFARVQQPNGHQKATPRHPMWGVGEDPGVVPHFVIKIRLQLDHIDGPLGGHWVRSPEGDIICPDWCMVHIIGVHSDDSLEVFPGFQIRSFFIPLFSPLSLFSVACCLLFRPSSLDTAVPHIVSRLHSHGGP